MKVFPKAEPPNWPEVVICHPAETAEAVSYFLFEAGASALVCEEVEGEAWLTRAGFSPEHALDALSVRLDRFLDELTSIFSLAEKPAASWGLIGSGDWSEKWKEGLEPIEVGPTLAIKPTWREYSPRPGQVVLEIDPGMAFGTGRHETTLMCLREIEDFFRRPEHQGRSVLDVGTGSGILALACVALGAGPVTAIDVDPETLPVAEENIVRNGFGGRISLVCGGPETARERFDLVLANLTAGDIIGLAGELAGLTAPGGRLVLSGILGEQAESVANAMKRLGLVQEKRGDDGEWTSLVFLWP
ncbi:MAG: 50S ribosomal protein L11 methyltransferase [Pseudomonadota bacterium]